MAGCSWQDDKSMNWLRKQIPFLSFTVFAQARTGLVRGEPVLCQGARLLPPILHISTYLPFPVDHFFANLSLK